MSRLNGVVVTVLGHPTPQSRREALSTALAECLNAERIDLTPPQTPERTARTTVQLGHAEIEVHPPEAASRLRAWPELLAVVALLLSDIHDQLATADHERAIAAITAELVDARLATAAELEQQRYQLERDLHDGAQHHMVALQMALGMVEHHLAQGEHAAAAGHLDRLHRLLLGTDEVLRATSTGLLATPLAEKGLAAALTARLAAFDDITIDIDIQSQSQRYAPEVEATAYLACLEAVSNAYKHAPGAEVTLTLRALPDALSFEVADTGPGFPEGTMPLPHLSARLALVGGTLEVESAPGRGSHVRGQLTA